MELKLMTFKLNASSYIEKKYIMIQKTRYMLTSLRFFRDTARKMVAFREWKLDLQSIQGSFLPHEDPYTAADILAYSHKLCLLLSFMSIPLDLVPSTFHPPERRI